MKIRTFIASLCVNIARLVVGLTFIFSGFVKAVDPLGTVYKLQDYAEAVGLTSIAPSLIWGQDGSGSWLLTALSIALSLFEFSLGIAMLFAMKRKQTTRTTLAFMIVMTCITVWIYIANPVSDCGCFGDAIRLTNGQTLLKNIVLTALTVLTVIWWERMPRLISHSNRWIVLHYSACFILVVAALSLYHLPLFDFRPYHIGADIKKGMEIPEGAEQPEFKTTFIMEKNGERREFGLDDYPDSTWTFIDSKSELIKAGYEPPIHDFTIERVEDGEDLTDSILSAKGYTFLLVAPHLEQADDTYLGHINEVYDYAKTNGYGFFCLTASGEKGISHWINITGAEYPFCNTDETTLKTIVRSNPGLLLLKGSTVVGKWSHRNIPVEEIEKGERITEKSTLLPQEDLVSMKLARIMMWYVLPLLLLTLIDRLFNIFNHFTHKTQKKKMAKKIVAGNWKMNKNLQEGVALAKELTEVVKNPNCGVIICTPFIHLASVAEIVKGSAIELGAENCADKASGAFTGEVSAEMVKSTGAQYVILGHSERREYYNETPEILKEKVQLALANGLKVIFCIGESLAEREANKQNEVVKAELQGSVFNLTAEEWKNIVIAYEPIWAIGTGKTATADQAEEIHAYIRSCVAEVYGAEVAAETTILYGGSCKASNAPELFAKPDIDGGLIGGASLKAADFKGIIDAWN